MALIIYSKDPEAIKDYVLDLKGLTHSRTGATSDYLEDGESLSSYTISADDGITVDNDSETDGEITYWVSGGVNGKIYDVTIHIITSANREDDFTVQFYTIDQ